MRFQLDTAELFVPDGVPDETALARTTHMAVGAHQDDLEILGIDGILRCFQNADRFFTGVVVTSGRGSPRDALYANTTDDEMRMIRIQEQKKAAVIGEYAAQIQLDYPSARVKDGSDKDPVRDITFVLKESHPEVVYTHNLADKHDTHVAVALRVIEAIRALPVVERPQRLFGCEIWRDLDWMLDTDKVVFDCSARESLQASLLGVFDSQICGGKRYDLATLGRRRANATFYATHGTDIATGMVFAMDLTALIEDESRSIQRYVQEYMDRLAQDAGDRLDRLQ